MAEASKTSPPEATNERREQTSPTTPKQKRQIDSDNDNNERQAKRARLTRKNLARFNKMEKSKGSRRASTHRESDDSTTTKSLSTTAPGFEMQARKNGMLEQRESKPPTNLEDIRKRHVKSRATASPPESAYNDYVDRVEEAENEATLVVYTSARILKEHPKGYKSVFNRAFTGFPRNVGFNNGLSAPQPDFIEGLEMKDYLPFPVDEYIDSAVLYKDSPRSVTLPHLAGEWKGPEGHMRTAKLQSAYDGAALVYARSQALAYMGRSDPPGHAEVTTFTTDGTNLNMYAHYATPSEEDKNTLEYHQFQYASANIKDSYQGHKEGRKGLRNQQDHARQQSYALRDQLKEHWRQRHDLQTITEGAPLPAVDGTYEANEDEAGYEVIEPPCQPTPDASLPPKNDYASSSRQKRKSLTPAKVTERILRTPPQAQELPEKGC
ncbi:hypothetical protein B0T19DRAFT_348997 [Cercophora scortea]|uniref:Uncharacterized protein n=1 Tax=Cercophora scortea TaxID=314031 RepID=A0AAE0MLK8_9PEZI|nr:hypothetical protein B0T19DRAFT_348997 [Cercophora scortea]